MALSVSTLEIFADRQPVEFGLTAGSCFEGFGFKVLSGQMDVVADRIKRELALIQN